MSNITCPVQSIAAACKEAWLGSSPFYRGTLIGFENVVGWEPLSNEDKLPS